MHNGLIFIFIIAAGLGKVPSRLIPPPVPSEEVPKTDLGLRQIVVGETFDVVLKLRPSTGFTWKVASISPGLVQVGEVRHKVDPDNTPGRMIGGTSLCVFTFQAKSVSQGAVIFAYLQPFAKDVPPIERAEIQFVALGK
jgi:predicted secreted protein